MTLKCFYFIIFQTMEIVEEPYSAEKEKINICLNGLWVIAIYNIAISFLAMDWLINSVGCYIVFAIAVYI